MNKKLRLMALAMGAVLALSACAQGTQGSDASIQGSDSAYLTGINAEEYVTLGDIDKLNVMFPEVTVTQEEIDARFSSYESRLTPVEVTDRDEAKEGDILTVDYSGRLKADGTVFDGGTAEGQTVEIGSTGYIEGFAEGMIGHKKGETFEEEVTFPAEYPNNPDLAGAEVIFTVTIHSITKRPVLTDENVAALAESDLGIAGITSIQGLRDYIQTELTKEKESSNLANLSTYALEEAVNGATFSDTLPQAVLSRYQEQLKLSYEQMATYYTQYFGMTDTTADSLIASDMEAESFTGTAEEFIQEKAAKELKQMLVCYAVFQKKELSYSEDELKRSIANVLLQNGYKSVAEFEEANGVNLRDAQSEQLVYTAAVNWLKENATVTTTPIEEITTDSSVSGEDSSDASSDASSEASSGEN